MDYSQLQSEDEISEWRSKYFNMEILNILRMNELRIQQIKECEDSSSSSSTTSLLERSCISEVMPAFTQDLASTFFHILNTEYSSVDQFYTEKFQEAEAKWYSLKDALTNLEKFPSVKPHQKTSKPWFSNSWICKPRISRYKEDLRSAIMDFHLNLIILRRFRQCNLARLKKVTEEFDKVTSSQYGENWLKEKFQHSQLCGTYKKLNYIISDVMNLFADYFTTRDHSKADIILKVPSESEKLIESCPSVFRSGLFLGAGLVLMSLAIHAGVRANQESRLPNRQITVDLFRSMFLFILYIILSALNIRLWEGLRINRVLILHLDPRDSISHVQLFEIAGGFSVLWLSALYLYYSGVTVSFTFYMWPGVVLLLALIYLVNPLRILQYKSRRWLMRIIVRTLTAPFHSVRLVDVWFTDQLISLVTLLVDLSFSVCYYSSRDWCRTNESSLCTGMLYGLRPLMGVLPSWLRLAQCLRCYRDTGKALPHLVNAGKYSTSFFVVLFSSLHASVKSSAVSSNLHGHAMANAMFTMWLISALVSSLYSFIWDIAMDWRLFNHTLPVTQWSLREERLIKSKAVYYAAVVQNLLLRFTWTLTMSIGEWSVIHSELVRTVVAVLELLRRFIWNIFRLEVEQLRNMDELKAVRECIVPLPVDCIDSTSLVVGGCKHRRTIYGTLSFA